MTFLKSRKAFHNALHGTPYELTQSAKDIFLMYNEQNRARMRFDEGLVVIHDPQPLPSFARARIECTLGLAVSHRFIESGCERSGIF